MRRVRHVAGRAWTWFLRLLWGSAPPAYDHREHSRVLAATSVEAERARMRSSATSSMTGGGL